MPGSRPPTPSKLYLPAIIDPEFHYEMVNVEVQQAQENSLFRWMRQLLHLRGRHPVFGRGSLHMLLPENHRIVAFVRSLEDQHVLVVANLAGSAQYAELDLAEYAGTRPVELFGRTEFPAVGELPYLVTLGPYAFYWFVLTPQDTDAPVHGVGTGPVPVVRLEGQWSEALEPQPRVAIERVLPAHLNGRRWFSGKGRAVAHARIIDVVPLSPRGAAVPAHLAFVRVRFREGEPATYALPLAVVGGERAEALLAELSHGVVAALQRQEGGETRVLSEALWEPSACRALLERACSRRARAGTEGELIGSPTAALRRLREDLGRARCPGGAGGAEQHLRGVRQPGDHEGVPPVAGGREPRPRDRRRFLVDPGVPPRPCRCSAPSSTASTARAADHGGADPGVRGPTRATPGTTASTP